MHISSIVAVGYNDRVNEPPLNEDAPWDEVKADKVSYPRTKHAGERLVLQTVAKRELDAVVVCPSNVVGASDARKDSRKNQIQAAQVKANHLPGHHRHEQLFPQVLVAL